MKALATSLAAMALSIGLAHADESTFLESHEGDWTGSGTVKVRIDSSPIQCQRTRRRVGVEHA